MPILPIGIGTNLDIDETTAKEGAPVVYVNCYADRAQAVRRNPPRRVFADLSAESIEEIYESVILGVVLAFGAGKVYSLASDGTFTELTGAEMGAGPMTVCEDGSHIFFAANSKIHKTDGVTVEILGDQSPQGVTSLVMFGPFLCANGAPAVGDYVPGDTHYSDDKENGYTAWEVFNNEYKADDLKAMVVLNHFLFAIGAETIETNFLSGDAANPISVQQAGSKDFGTPARYSVATDKEAIYLLSVVGESRKILRMRGGVDIDPIGIPLSIPLEEIERIDDARGYIAGFRGQNFYVLTFPTANVTIAEMSFPSLTLAYHLQSKSWYVWGEWDSELAHWASFKGQSFRYVQQWGKRLLGGNDGVIYEIYENTDIDYALAPVFTLRWRDNGKREWTNGRTVEIGSIGDYDTIRHIRGCGVYRSRQLELTFTDATGFKMLIRSGNFTYGTSSREKRCVAYHLSIKAGTNDFVINSAEEELSK